MAKPAYRTAEYLAAKRDLKLNQWTCVYCRAVIATTIDHIPSLAEIPDGHKWQGQLVPACARCNSSRGGKLGAARRAENTRRRARHWKR